MKIPNVGVHWTDKSADLLGSVQFEVYAQKIDDIVEEFGGSRKQSKLDTIIDGLTKASKPAIAEKLVGRKFIISTRSDGKPTYITTLSSKTLRNIPLPQEWEDTFKKDTATPAPQNVVDPFAGATTIFQKAFNSTPTNSKLDDDERRIALGGKLLLYSIAGYLKPTFVDSQDDIFIMEVQREFCPAEFASSVLRGGEKENVKDTVIKLSYGMQKNIE